MKIINLTQHTATAEQLQAGVTDLQGSDVELLKELLTFEELPSQKLLEERAGKVALLARASGAQAVMIGGAPFFMAYLERALKAEGLRVLYAFSVRESTEKVDADGNVHKVAVFRHKGWVEV